MIRQAESGRDFLFALRLWTTKPPYRDFPCKTIGWRLAPAFSKGRLLTLLSDGAPVGFVTWGWMTDEEFKTRKYSGEAAFSRDRSDRLVVVDGIITQDVPKLLSELRSFFRSRYPGVNRVHVHRGPRDGHYCI
jgi:hypothetical protein